MRGQDVFDVGGVDVEAAGDDHVLLAVPEHHEAVFVEPAHVAGADEALAPGVVPLGRAGGLGPAVIADHHAGATAHDLTGFATRQFAAFLIDHAHVAAAGGRAHCVQLVRIQVGLQDAGGAAFGHAVVLDQPARPALEHIGLQRGGKGRAGAELHDEVAQVVLVEGRKRQQPAVLHGHEHGVRGMVPLAQPQVVLRMESWHQQHRPTKGQRGEEDHQRGVGIQRGGQHGHAVGLIAITQATLHVGPAHAVGLHDALGLAGGARGIDDVEGRAGRDVHGMAWRPLGGTPRSQRRAPRAAIEHHALRTALPWRPEGLRAHRIQEQPLCTGVLHHALQHRRGGTWRQRCHHHPGAQGTKEHRRVLD